MPKPIPPHLASQQGPFDESLWQAECNAEVPDRFYARPDLPRHIRRNEKNIKHYTYNWIAWHLLRSGCKDVAIDWLKAAAMIQGRDGADCVADWTQQFGAWSQDAGVGSAHDEDFREAIEMASLAVKRRLVWRSIIMNWLGARWKTA